MVAAGPLVIITMRSESSTASSTSCVTIRVVAPAAATMRISSSCRFARVSASSAPSGSSSSNTFGLHGQRACDTDALLHAAGQLVRMLVRGVRQADQRQGVLGTLLELHPVLGLAGIRVRPRGKRCRRRSATGNEWFWNTTARSGPGPAISRSPRISTPLVASSNPASRFSSVDLPQPEWPMIETNSPRRMLRLMFSRATKRPLRYRTPCGRFQFGHELFHDYPL